MIPSTNQQTTLLCSSCSALCEETLADTPALWGTVISGLLAEPDELVTAGSINQSSRIAHVVGRVRLLACAPGGLLHDVGAVAQASLCGS
jgi:hypothetical protein